MLPRLTNGKLPSMSDVLCPLDIISPYPNFPNVPSPQHLILLLVVKSAHAWVPKTLTCINCGDAFEERSTKGRLSPMSKADSPLFGTVWAGMPMPNNPCVLDPQHLTPVIFEFWFNNTLHVVCNEADILMDASNVVPKSTSGRLELIFCCSSVEPDVPNPSWPWSFFPQHFTLWLSMIAHVWECPAVSCSTVLSLLPIEAYGRLLPIWPSSLPALCSIDGVNCPSW